MRLTQLQLHFMSEEKQPNKQDWTNAQTNKHIPIKKGIKETS